MFFFSHSQTFTIRVQCLIQVSRCATDVTCRNTHWNVTQQEKTHPDTHVHATLTSLCGKKKGGEEGQWMKTWGETQK